MVHLTQHHTLHSAVDSYSHRTELTRRPHRKCRHDVAGWEGKVGIS